MFPKDCRIHSIFRKKISPEGSLPGRNRPFVELIEWMRRMSQTDSACYLFGRMRRMSQTDSACYECLVGGDHPGADQ